MNDDLISRQAALDAIDKNRDALLSCGRTGPEHILVHYGRRVIEELPSAQQTLYGYRAEHLAYIARVMEKEGVTAEYAVRTFDDMSRAIKMIIEEAQQKVEETLNERFNKQAGGD